MKYEIICTVCKTVLRSREIAVEVRDDVRERSRKEVDSAKRLYKSGKYPQPVIYCAGCGKDEIAVAKLF
jgi:hypothetical protein